MVVEKSTFSIAADGSFCDNVSSNTLRSRLSHTREQFSQLLREVISQNCAASLNEDDKIKTALRVIALSISPRKGIASVVPRDLLTYIVPDAAREEISSSLEKSIRQKLKDPETWAKGLITTRVATRRGCSLFRGAVDCSLCYGNLQLLTTSLQCRGLERS